MKKWILLVCVAALASGIGFLLVQSNKQAQPRITPAQPVPAPDVDVIHDTSDTLTIQGIVTAKQDNCIVDGLCTVTIGDIKVITNQEDSSPPGGSVPPRGSHIGAALHIGSKAEAYGRKIESKVITLIGSTDYYTKSLD